MEFTKYRRTQIAEMRPYVEGERLDILVPPVSISAVDANNGSPKTGDMIARNPANHADQWLVAADYFAANFEPLDGDAPANKETSSSVSSLAAHVLAMEPSTDTTVILSARFNALLENAKTLAGSALSQDETPGQGTKPAGDFLSRLKDEREELDARLRALNSYLTHNPEHPTPRHRQMLQAQAGHMSEYLAVLDERLADIAISQRSAPVEPFDAGDEELEGN